MLKERNNRYGMLSIMRFFLALLVLYATMVSVVYASNGTRQTAGAAEVVITHVKDRPEVYLDLYARTLVLGKGSQRLAVVTLDLGTISYQVSDQLLRAINQATGIPTENILICTSQTHSAPGVDGRHLTPESRKWLADTLAQLVKSAVDKLQPATLRFGRAPVQIGYNRRLMKDGRIIMEPNPDGAVVPWVDTLSAYDKKNKLIGVLYSHAAHPVIVHWSSKAIGPDFPGYTVKHLRNLLTEQGQPDSVYLYLQGCCGNINGYPLRGGFAACDAAGLALAFAVTQALESDRRIGSGKLRSRDMTLSLPRRPPPSVAECQKVLAEQPDNKRYQALLKLAESGQTEFLRFPMRAVAIGNDVCIMMFAEYQLFADKASPFKHTFVLSHVNGISSYVATKKDYDLGPAGGYEAWEGPCRGHSMPLDPSVEKIVRDGMIRLLKKLKHAK